MGSIRTDLDPFTPIRTDTDPSGSIRTDPDQSGSIRTRPVVRSHSGPVRIHSGSIIDHMYYQWKHRGIDLDRSEPILPDSDRSRSVRTDPDQSGPIRTRPVVRTHSGPVRIHSGSIIDHVYYRDYVNRDPKLIWSHRGIHSGPIQIHIILSGPIPDP